MHRQWQLTNSSARMGPAKKVHGSCSGMVAIAVIFLEASEQVEGRAYPKRKAGEERASLGMYSK